MRVTQLKIRDIRTNENNPRGIDISTEDEKLSYLKDSIKQFGVMVPVVATPRDGKFFLIDGERRYHAAKAVGLKKVPAYVIESADGSALGDDELLFRMFQIHHLREQWGPVQQCHALESTYQKIAKSPQVRAAKTERDKLKILGHELAEVTGIEERTAGDRVKFLRWPSTIKKAIYKHPDDSQHAYVLEIEDKIIQPAISNYPEYFKNVLPDVVRADLFEKLKSGISSRDEIRNLAPYFRTSFTRPKDRTRFCKALRRLHNEKNLTFSEAAIEFAHEFPDLLKQEAPSPRRLLSMFADLRVAVEEFDIATFKTARRRAKANPTELAGEIEQLTEVLAELLAELKEVK